MIHVGKTLRKMKPNILFRFFRLFQMFTDTMFGECIVDMAYRLSSPVYSYYYNYQNEYSFNKAYGSCKKPLGVTHTDELNSLFKMPAFNPKDLNKKDLEVSRLSIDIWYNFASTK